MDVDKALEIPAISEAPVANGAVRTRPAAFDAYRVHISAIPRYTHSANELCHVAGVS